MPKLFENTGGEGIFVSEAKITEVKVNDEPGQYPKDINYIFKVMKKVNDDEYPATVFISGNVMKNDSLSPSITSLLVSCGIHNMPNKETIVDLFSKSSDSPIVTNFFVGKTIKILSYVSGTYTANGEVKPSYKIWDGRQQGFANTVNTYDVNTPNEDIVKAFTKQLKTTYPPKYTPEVLVKKESAPVGSEDEYGTPPDGFIPNDEENV